MSIETSRTFRAKAPIRIDLAGGTLDLWPLYLLLPKPITVNLAIDLCAEATLTEKKVKASQAFVKFISLDQKFEVETSWEELEKSENPPPWVSLPWKLLRYYSTRKKNWDPKTTSIEFKTLSRSPAGAGLGGSSGINIAANGAISAWADVDEQGEFEKRSLISISRDLETQVLRVPAGLQDYYAAMFGGLQSITWGVGQHERVSLSQETAKKVSERVLLFYSGQSRNSGINNWTLFKGLIDGDPSVRSKFESIGGNAHELDLALRKLDFAGAERAIEKEWKVRKTLASGITTPEIDAALTRAGKEGGKAAKICGAGGGGCFFVFCPDDDPDRMKKIKQAVAQGSISSLPFKPSMDGLKVERPT